MDTVDGKPVEMIVCGALSDGDSRYPRPEGKECQCKDGWGGVNCNGKVYSGNSMHPAGANVL